jgi:hypothetical protein
MTIAPSLPNELLEFIFRDLTPADWKFCSYTLWQWNDVANAFLYDSVKVFSNCAFKNLIDTLENWYMAVLKATPGSDRMRLQVCKIIKVVKVVYLEGDASGQRHQHSYLAKLIAVCPNIHIVQINDPESLFGPLDTARRRNIWKDVNDNWPLFRHLTIALRDDYPLHYAGVPIAAHGIEHVANRLHSLDMTQCRWLLSALPLPTPAFTSLRSLKVTLHSFAECVRLKEIVAGCQNTIETLWISWMTPETAKTIPPDITSLIVDLPKLTSLGVSWQWRSSFILNSFGSRLQELELLGPDPYESLPVDAMMGEALAHAANLKKLAIVGCLTKLLDRCTYGMQTAKLLFWIRGLVLTYGEVEDGAYKKVQQLVYCTVYQKANSFPFKA